MKPETQRCAIVEACGGRIEVGPFDSIIFKTSDGRSFGDPLTDLNAMHEAEKVLNGIQFRNYTRALMGIAEPYPVIATAAHRAEAFLRTIGKWEDDQ